MRQFDSDQQAINWIKDLVKEYNERPLNVRLGYHDDKKSMSKYNQKKQKGKGLYPYSLDTEAEIDGRKISIGCDMRDYKKDKSLIDKKKSFVDNMDFL